MTLTAGNGANRARENVHARTSVVATVLSAFMMVYSTLSNAGFAAVRPETNDLRNCDFDHQYFSAMRAQKSGIDALSRKEFVNALHFLDQGLESLGDIYLHNGLLDDSGMKLVLARSKESQGDLETAAHIMRRVLESRLAAYRDKLNCTPKEV